MKKYLEFIKESSYLNAISTETLENKLEDLRLQMTEIQEEIASIVSILDFRKTNDVTEFAKTLPESIFDFNQEQLDFIFEHHHGVGKAQYDLARQYYRDFVGVGDYGFNKETNQTSFSITTRYSFNNDEDYADEYQENEEQIKAIKFLGENLKKVDDSVKFYVSYYFSTVDLDFVLYVSETELYITNLYGKKVRYNSISKMLEELVNEDLSHKDNGWER
jgi:hypothetical protein